MSGSISTEFALPHVTNELAPIAMNFPAMAESYNVATVTYTEPQSNEAHFDYSLPGNVFHDIRQDDYMYIDYDFSIDLFGVNKGAEIASFSFIIDNSVWKTLSGPKIVVNEHKNFGIYTRQCFVVLQALFDRAVKSLPVIRVVIKMNYPDYAKAEVAALFGVAVSRYLADFSHHEEDGVYDLSLLFYEEEVENNDYVVV